MQVIDLVFTVDKISKRIHEGVATYRYCLQSSWLVLFVLEGPTELVPCSVTGNLLPAFWAEESMADSLASMDRHVSSLILLDINDH
jgi:hypothetical protein